MQHGLVKTSSGCFLSISKAITEQSVFLINWLIKNIMDIPPFLFLCSSQSRESKRKCSSKVPTDMPLQEHSPSSAFSGYVSLFAIKSFCAGSELLSPFILISDPYKRERHGYRVKTSGFDLITKDTNIWDDIQSIDNQSTTQNKTGKCIQLTHDIVELTLFTLHTSWSQNILSIMLFKFHTLTPQSGQSSTSEMTFANGQSSLLPQGKLYLFQSFAISVRGGFTRQSLVPLRAAKHSTCSRYYSRQYAACTEDGNMLSFSILLIVSAFIPYSSPLHHYIMSGT